jgi:phage repressor protein C with HTH and peptisase S24 domain
LVSDDDIGSAGAPKPLREILANVPNMSELSRISGINRRSLDRYRDGMEPSLNVAAKLARALNLPLDALVYGVSDQHASESPGKARGNDEWLRRGEDSNLVYVPLSTAVASAGAGIANDGVEEARRLPFSRSLLREHGIAPDNAHFVTARGDSMEPTIQDGGIVLFDASRRSLHDPGVYVLTVYGDLLIKRVQPTTRGLILISDNERYKPETIERGDLDSVNVVGKVFWVGSKL